MRHAPPRRRTGRRGRGRHRRRGRARYRSRGLSREAPGPDRHEAVECGRVAVVRGEPGRESVRRLLELPLRLVDPGLTGEPGEYRESRLRHALLRQVADGRPLGRARHRPIVRGLVTGDDPEQRRLAHAVRPHQADARLRADAERDLIENDLGAVVLADARELHSHGRPPRPWTSARRRRTREREWSRQSVMRRPGRAARHRRRHGKRDVRPCKRSARVRGIDPSDTS